MWFPKITNEHVRERVARRNLRQTFLGENSMSLFFFGNVVRAAFPEKCVWGDFFSGTRNKVHRPKPELHNFFFLYSSCGRGKWKLSRLMLLSKLSYAHTHTHNWITKHKHTLNFYVKFSSEILWSYSRRRMNFNWVTLLFLDSHWELCLKWSCCCWLGRKFFLL